MTPAPHSNQETWKDQGRLQLTLWQQLPASQQKQLAQCLARLIQKKQNQSGWEEEDDEVS